MDLKQSVQNIQTWVKAHPWAAAAIIGGVILLAFYMSKKVGSSGAVNVGSAEETSSSGGPLDSLGSGSSGGGFGNVLSSLGESASPDINTSAPVTSIPSMTGQSLNEALASPVPRLSSSFSIPPSVSAPAIVGLAGLESAGPGPGSVSGLGSGPGPGVGISKRVAKNNPLKKEAIKKQTAAKTPAMSHGRGQHFTGWADGIYFVNGWPVSASPIPGTVIMPGGRTASNDILGLSGGSKGKKLKTGR
jgi:hypothetical protein